MQLKRRHKNVTSYERELIGPDSYEYFSSISKSCQKSYINSLRAQLLLLLVVAIISIFPILDETLESYLQAFNILLMVLVLVLMILQYANKYMEGWQKARFLAESILSNCWLLIFKCGIYTEEEYNDALAKFQNRVKEMVKEVNIKGFLSVSSPITNDNDNPSWMSKNFSEAITQKKEFYIKYRIKDQVEWYKKKAKFNKDNSFQYFVYGLISMIIGIILTTLILLKLIPNLSYLGLFTTISASLFSWKQTKRYDELKTTYSVAAVELKDFENALLRQHKDGEIQETVLAAEKSISREHKLWFSKIPE